MEKIEPLVSIIIPLYNKKATVARAIASVQAQTFGNWECIVVNNNSTDNPNQTVFKAIAGDERLTYYNCEAQGVAHARNYGIARARGFFIVCLDADDEIRPTFVAVCLKALAADNWLAIAYTRMEVVLPVDKRRVSDWPGKFNYDEFLKRKNQVPTCCMFRREYWERLGGFRQRYAPRGAGTEDAEFWLRIGAAGGKAELVCNDPLFVYYVGDGITSQSDYTEVDWLAGKPYVTDGKHPFASVATPANEKAHLVRQADEPTVTVVIPCGPGHLQYLWDALDSLEAQTLRRWECIVVFDGETESTFAERQRISSAFPFARFAITVREGSGAGVARNMGVSLARAPLILFLDADDWLHPQALELMMKAYIANPGHIIYSDYLGYAYIGDENEVERLRLRNRVVSHDVASKQTVLRYFSANYDCERAIRQPEENGKLYIWNVISSLLPKQYHLDIGGFDESMESWEDWDYWIRLAREGKCFTRIEEPLLHYRFHTGTRRVAANPGESGDFGRQLSAKLLSYMIDKYKRSKVMPGCRSCGSGGHPPPPPPAMRNFSLNEGRVTGMSAQDMVRVRLIDGNIGSHPIIFQRTNYDYRSHGDEFLMQREHAKLDRRVIILGENNEDAAFVPTAKQVAETPPPPTTVEVAAAKVAQEKIEAAGDTDPSPAPLPIYDYSLNEDKRQLFEAAAQAEKKEIVIEPKVFDFASLWGLNEDRAAALVASGVRTLDGLKMLGPDRLANLIGVEDNTAKNILARVAKLEVEA